MILIPLVGLNGGGAAGRAILLTNHDVEDVGFTPQNAFAGFRLGADGQVYSSYDGSYAVVVNSQQQWLYPPDDVEADNYECYATTLTGLLTSGTVGSWLSLDADQTWTCERTSDVPGQEDWSGTIEIRRKGTTTVLAIATILLVAEVA